MTTRTTPLHVRTGAALALVAGLALGTSACADGDGDDGEPDDTSLDELDTDPNVPFDPNVPGGVGTETDERNNQGFDVDEPGPVGNLTNPND